MCSAEDRQDQINRERYDTHTRGKKPITPEDIKRRASQMAHVGHKQLVKTLHQLRKPQGFKSIAAKVNGGRRQRQGLGHSKSGQPNTTTEAEANTGGGK